MATLESSTPETFGSGSGTPGVPVGVPPNGVGSRPASGSGRRSVLALGLVLAAGLCAAVSVPALLLLGPGFLLFFVLSLGFFPGESVVHRVAGRCRRWRIRSLDILEATPETLNLVVKAGRRIAYALAVRPPPVSSIYRV